MTATSDLSTTMSKLKELSTDLRIRSSTKFERRVLSRNFAIPDFLDDLDQAVARAVRAA